MKLAIIIPAYNEALTIEKVIRQFHEVLPQAGIYVIDNNSTDDTRNIAEQTFNTLNCFGKIIFVERQGKGHAIKRAFFDIQADIYVMVDADCTYDPNDLPLLLQVMKESNCDMVIGDRISKGEYRKTNTRPFHDFGNNLVVFIINLLFKDKIKDAMSGYRVFNAYFVNHFPIFSQGFELETEMTLHALDKEFKIKEVPVQYYQRIEGSFSKLNTIKDGIRVIKTIFHIFKDYQPFYFFSFWSILFFISGFLMGCPVIIEFIKTSYITKVPSAILASGLMLMATLSVSIALILDTVVRNYKANFYINLLNHKDRFKNF